MKRASIAGFIACGWLWHAGVARAQTSVDALQRELDDVAQQHQEATTQSLANFFSQVDAAMGDSQVALALYQTAGGAMPAPTPVTTQHDIETPTEKATREAQDKANAAPLAGILELHCGMMHFAALFVTDPNRKGLADDFNAWLEKAAQTYPLVISNAPPVATGGDSGGGAGAGAGEDTHGGHHHRQNGGGGGGGGGPAFGLNDVKGKPVRDSIISKYLGFKMWGDKAQGGWSVRQIPQLYRANILEPLRVTPTAATLASWDVYIAMANADETDAEKFASTTYPPLQFDRACDAYAVEPTSEKLEAVLEIIKANPTHPQSDDWLARAKKLIDDYGAKHGGRPAIVDNTAPPAPGPATNSNVTVTTQQQGDATIITTHTNAAPNAPAH
jgi:hypothetical protein